MSAAAALGGRVALVTGAARGIGRAVAEALAAHGATVAVCDVIPTVARVLDGDPHCALRTVADAAEPEQMARFVEQIVAEHGRLDTVVANAGVAERGSPRLDVVEATDVFDRMLVGNLRTSFVTVRAAMPRLVETGGDVVLVSTDHVCPAPGGPQKALWMEGYDAAKWGLVGLQRNWALNLAANGVRVNTVAMGETDTDMLRGFLARAGVPDEEIETRSAGWMDPAVVAAAVVDLLADPDPSRTDTLIGLWPGHPVEVRIAATVRTDPEERPAPPAPSRPSRG